MAKKQNFERTKTIPLLNFSLELFYKDGFLYKPPDTWGTRFTQEKPFDIFFTYDDVTCAIEAKYMGIGPFTFNSVKSHQIENLVKIEKNGALAYIAIHYKNKRIEQVAFIEIYDFLHLVETYHKKSMHWSEIQKDDHFTFILDVESYDVGPGKYKKYVNFYGTYLIGE
jgi:hypothetical protein